jgi:hypothetical protein
MSVAPDVDLVASIRAHLGASTSAPPDVAAFHLARVRVLFVALADEVRSLEHVLIAREQAMLARAEVRQGLEARSEAPTESGAGTTQREPVEGEPGYGCAVCHKFMRGATQVAGLGMVHEACAPKGYFGAPRRGRTTAREAKVTP